LTSKFFGYQYQPLSFIDLDFIIREVEIFCGDEMDVDDDKNFIPQDENLVPWDENFVP
jgi:hypothetical protein